MKRILVVDDYKELARLTCEVLDLKGYSAVAAYDADEALEKLNQDAFDVMVTDYDMPGTNGAQLAKQVRAVSPTHVILLITNEQIEPGDAIDAVVRKETLFPDLIEQIGRLLNYSRASNAVA